MAAKATRACCCAECGPTSGSREGAQSLDIEIGDRFDDVRIGSEPTAELEIPTIPRRRRRRRFR